MSLPDALERFPTWAVPEVASQAPHVVTTWYQDGLNTLGAVSRQLERAERASADRDRVVLARIVTWLAGEGSMPIRSFLRDSARATLDLLGIGELGHSPDLATLPIAPSLRKIVDTPACDALQRWGM